MQYAVQETMRSQQTSLIRRIFTGNLQRNELKTYIPITFFSYMLSLMLSYVFYPIERNYSVFTHTISYLGNYKVNPGWIFFSISIWIQTITVIPLFHYLKRHMAPINNWAEGTSVWMYYISFILSFITACLPDTQDHSPVHRAHIWVASIAFATYAIAGMLFWIRGRRVFPKFPVRFLCVSYYTGLLFMFVSQLYAIGQHISTLEPGVFSLPMWEWFLYFLNIAYFYSLVIFVPLKTE